MGEDSLEMAVAFVGEAWGEFEAVARHPFVGVSGVCLFDLLCDAGWTDKTEADHSDIRDFWWFWNQWTASGKYGERDDKLIETRPLLRIWGRRPEWKLTNVFNLRPPNNDLEALCVPKTQAPSGLPSLGNGKYISQNYLGELIRLGSDLKEVGLVVCLGGTATWALLHNPLISKLRGTVAAATVVAPGKKIIAAYHPAAVLRQWELRHVTVLDLMKAKRESGFTEVRRPKRQVHIPETLDDLYTLQQLTPLGSLAIDIETHTDEITCVGFAFTDDRAVVIPFTDPRRDDGSYWRTFIEEKLAWDVVRKLCGSSVPKVFQNGLYDVNFLWSKYGIPVNNFAEDTMLAHHCLQPEAPKALDYLGSVYTNEPAWKLMNRRGKTTIKKDD
jgi:uracil-DNA glycosylase